ncbi:MAG TPA: GNAT family N-acetyltransferase [Acidimicrobiia bacterium]|nr:GNAT family N-acetyltransferase [Acidimicrobiia bacterium]
MSTNPDALAALCQAAMPEERLTAGELEYLCFGENDEVFGDERGAAVLQTQTFGKHLAAWLTLVVVYPDDQGRGRGKELVAAVAERARALGARDLLLASAVPRYLWPGVDVFNTRVGMLLETCGFERDWVGTNMSIDTAFRKAAPARVIVERETGTGAHDFAARAYDYWVPELDRAVAMGTAFAARDATGATIGFGCHSVNRFGWIGPMATEPALQHGGVGSAIVGALCADLEARGCATGEISWVSNLRFYGKCGARVSRVFVGGRLALEARTQA